jgi:hexosaminidase
MTKKTKALRIDQIKIILLLCLIGSFQSFAQSGSIIPLPNEYSVKTGSFNFSPQTVIVCNTESVRSDVNWFNETLEKNYGFKLKVSKTVPANGNYLIFETPDWEAGWKENYHLSINTNEIRILAEGNGSGNFYALQSLLQLIPVQILKNTKKAPPVSFAIPCVDIKDSPRFKWRGMHLDVCRHFFPITFIKKYIDLLASYKMNTFHWHLTEDQGWRIEIKKYPKLTSVGAWRNGTMIGKYGDQKYDSIKYGGYYTQEEIKEVVAYANKLHVTIVPEIEMPGHSVAAIAAYPWLSCTGKQIEVAKGWGVFDDVYCTKDSTFQFLQDVLTEVVALFPGKYIHIGGDECPKTRWKSCNTCQAKIKKEGLANEHELQSYFIRRIEKFLNSKGKQIIGWDEILEGGLAPNAAVMSWRGTQGGIDAAKQKHEVVMSPGKPCYFDHYQSKDTEKEPLAIGGYNPIDSVYAYEPLPKSLTPAESAFIMGAQANVWTEYILTENQVEYMAVPRMLALSEVLWTKPELKNYPQFIIRLKDHAVYLDRKQVNYAKHFLIEK